MAVPDEWKVRIAGVQDIPALVAFNLAIARETESLDLDIDVLTRGVTRGLEQGDEVCYLVAEGKDGVIGQLMLTREWSDWRDGWMIWIQSVYVTESHRGRGVFRSLLDCAVERTKQRSDVVGMRLYVVEENKRAQEVYYRTGFVDPKYKVLERMLTHEHHNS